MSESNAREAKNHFGRLLHDAQKEPVTINKNGYPVAVVLSIGEYQLFEKLKQELWLEKAQEAEKEGFIGERQSDELIENLLNA